MMMMMMCRILVNRRLHSNDKTEFLRCKTFCNLWTSSCKSVCVKTTYCIMLLTSLSNLFKCIKVKYFYFLKVRYWNKGIWNSESGIKLAAEYHTWPQWGQNRETTTEKISLVIVMTYTLWSLHIICNVHIIIYLLSHRELNSPHQRMSLWCGEFN